MWRSILFLACPFCLALAHSPARAEFDSGGVPTKPAQLQANRPPQTNQQQRIEDLLQLLGTPTGNLPPILIDVSDNAIPVIFLAPPRRPLIVQPAPPKKVAPNPAKPIPPIPAKPILIPPVKK